MLPFFVFLDWKGWFRADALDEVVGLDMSYHGGVVLGSENDVKPEYIQAYKERKEGRVSQRSSGASSKEFSFEKADLEDEEQAVFEETEHIDIDDSEDYSSRRGSGHVSVEA